MQYIIEPTQDDILHYAKGSESKAHKYISRVFSKGRWVYTYAKNKARGNAVTNKNGTPYSPTVKTTPAITNNTKGVTPYNPTIKTVKSSSEELPGQLSNWVTGHRITEALAENMTAETKVDGLAIFANLMASHRKEAVGNNTNFQEFNGPSKQYTPKYKTSPKPYSPTISSTTLNGTTYYSEYAGNKGSTKTYNLLKKKKKK